MERLSLRDALEVLFRNAGLIVLATVLATLTVGVYLATSSTTYGAEARVLVGIGREKLEDAGVGTGPVANLVFQERAQNVNNEVEILRDPSLMTRVLPKLKARLERLELATEDVPRTGVRAFVYEVKHRAKAAKAWITERKQQAVDALVSAGLMKPVDPDVALAVRFYHALAVTAVKETDVIAVGFTWDDPAFAADAVNIYIEEYMTQRLSMYEPKQAVSFYEVQLEKAQAELHAVEADLAGFMHTGGLGNFDMEKTQLITQLAIQRQDASGARLEQQTDRMKLAAIERAYQDGNSWVETLDTGDTVAGAQALDQSFVQLLDQRTRLLSRFQPGAEQVRDIDNQIARLRSQKFQGLSALYRSRLASVNEKVARLDNDIATKDAALRGMTGQTAEYDSIQRRRSSAEALVVEYRRKLEELEVNRDMNAQSFSSVRVLSPALPPVVPSSSNRALMLGLAAAFGLLGGIAYAVIAEFVSRTFRRPGQIVGVLHLPVLAIVPDLR